MPYCKKCGAELEEKANFCPKCGSPVSSQVSETAGAVGQRRTPLSPTSIAMIGIGAVLLFAVISISLGFLNPTGTIVGSGNLITREEAYSGFTSVSVNSGFKFYITHSDSYRVTVTSDDNLVNYLEVTKSGGTLHIVLKPGYSIQSTSLKVEITMPSLSGLDLNGGANGEASGFTSSSDLAITSSGGGKVKMAGEAYNLVISASGGSSLDLLNFHVNNANIDLSGGCQVTINLDGRLDATCSGGSHIIYTGNPTMGNINTSGGGTITKK